MSDNDRVANALRIFCTYSMILKTALAECRSVCNSKVNCMIKCDSIKLSAPSGLDNSSQLKTQLHTSAINKLRAILHETYLEDLTFFWRYFIGFYASNNYHLCGQVPGQVVDA